MGNNVVRLTPSGGGLNIAAHYQTRVSGDNDLQSGVTILGSTGLVVGAGKDGNINLLGQSDLSLKQSPALGGTLNLFAFWNGSAGPMLFAWPESGPLHAYQVGGGPLTDKGTNSEQRPGHPAGVFTVSSNGTMPGTGIVWATVPLVGDAWHSTATGALYAFDASDITKSSLWNSNLNPQTSSELSRSTARPWSPTARSMSRPSQARCAFTVSSEATGEIKRALRCRALPPSFSAMGVRYRVDLGVG